MKGFFILILLVMATSAKGTIPYSPDADTPDDCYHKELKISIKKGETAKPTNIGKCLEMTCQYDGVIRTNECGRFPTQCPSAPSDYSKEYPDCCPQFKCP